MKVDLFRRTGIMALGSRLRIFTDMVTSDASRIYSIYGLDVQATWFPVLFALIDGKPLSVVEIARRIGHSHPSVIKICRGLTAAGIVQQRPSTKDKRSTEVSLTAKGRKMVPILIRQCEDVEAALEQIDCECSQRLWTALDEWEEKMGQRSLYDRVMEAKVMRDRDAVQIVNYDDALHHEAFVGLNEHWIRELFGVVEEADHRELDNPLESIIAKGGQIFIAELDGKPVGSFAMMRRTDKYDWELVKLAVDPAAQGHGIGMRLIRACIRRARMVGGYRLFIESNFKCAAAVHLYEKAGFRHIKVESSPYARCDVQMEMTLE